MSALEWIGSAGVFASVWLYVRHTRLAAVIGMLANLVLGIWAGEAGAWGIAALNLGLLLVNLKNYIIVSLMTKRS